MNARKAVKGDERNRNVFNSRQPKVYRFYIKMQKKSRLAMIWKIKGSIPLTQKTKTHHKGRSWLFGGDGGDRTHDLLNAIQALSQLSYAPEY